MRLTKAGFSLLLCYTARIVKGEETGSQETVKRDKTASVFI